MINRKESSRKYYQNHKEECKQRTKKYAEQHKEKNIEIKRKAYQQKKEAEGRYWLERYQNRKEYYKQYAKGHRININTYELNRKNKYPMFRILHNLRSRVYRVLIGASKSKSTINLLGCSLEDFKQYLENKFTDGLNWSNYGKWHIDHIVPCCQFDLSKQEEQKKCFHYTNLQPLWAIDNLKKHKKP